MNISRIGSVTKGLGALAPSTKRLGVHGIAFGGVLLGGAATGYLAAGSKRGAAIGALVHLALFGVVGGVFGANRGLTNTERLTYGVLGLGSAVSAGYLFYWTRR